MWSDFDGRGIGLYGPMLTTPFLRHCRPVAMRVICKKKKYNIFIVLVYNIYVVHTYRPHPETFYAPTGGTHSLTEHVIKNNTRNATRIT